MLRVGRRDAAPATAGGAAAGPPRRFRWDWLFGIPFAALFALIVFASGLALREGQEMRLARDARTAAEAPPPIPTNWQADFPARLSRVTAALTRRPIALPAPVEEPQGADTVRWVHRRYEIQVPGPEAAAEAARSFTSVADAAPGVTVRIAEHAAATHVLVGVDGLLTHTIVLRWARRQPRMAIVLDGLGSNLLLARDLAAIDAPLTFAVQPFEPFAREVAELVSLYDRQVLLHLPPPDLTARRTQVDEAAVLRSLNDGLATLPRAAGVMDDRDDGVGADPARARWVLGRLKEDALFFIDGRTDQGTVACDVAAELALPCLKAAMVLRETEDEQAISTQLEKLTQLAQTRGDALAILRAGPGTVTALRSALGRVTAAGVELTPASSVVFDRFLSGR